MNCARVFYDMYDGAKQYAFVCTCGHFERFTMRQPVPKQCPNCKKTNAKIDYKFISSWYEKALTETFKNINILDIKSKKFYIKKCNISTKLFTPNKENYSLKVLKQEVFETYFDTENPKNIKIICDGKEINPTKHNIQRALSNIPIGEKFKDTIFGDYYEFKNCKYSLTNIVLDFIDFPQYEIFYNTYGTFEGIKNLNKRYFKKGKSPSEILGLNKSIWNCIYSINQSLDNDGIVYMQFDDILPFVSRNKTKPDHINKVIEVASKINISNINQIIELYEWNYNPDRLLEYLTEDIYTYQGIDNPVEGLQLLYDYVRMNKLLETDFEKYPKSLKLRHDLTNKNVKIQLSDIELREMQLVLNSEAYQRLSFKGKKYSVILPTSGTDIVNEGKALSHCVGSYLDLVKNKKTMILFMRNNEDLNKSLITLEVRNDTLRQYAGFGDRTPNAEEMEFIELYCKNKQLNINDKHAMYYRD